MSQNIEQNHVEQFHTSVDLLAQQQGSKLRGSVRVESIMGESSSWDQLDSVEMFEKTTRHGDTQVGDIDHKRRWVTPVPYERAELIDKEDMVRTLPEWTNPYTRSLAMAAGRKMDDLVLDAAFAAAKTGKDGSGSTAFDTTNMTVDSTGTNPLTVAKVLEARRRLMDMDEDDTQDWYIACSPRQLENMVALETEVQSIDTNAVKALVRGDITFFGGFNWIVTTRINLDANSDDLCVAWVKDALLLGLARDTTARISERDDKSYLTQVYYAFDGGSTRMRETGVVKIICNAT